METRTYTHTRTDAEHIHRVIHKCVQVGRRTHASKDAQGTYKSRQAYTYVCSNIYQYIEANIENR